MYVLTNDKGNVLVLASGTQKSRKHTTGRGSLNPNTTEFHLDSPLLSFCKVYSFIPAKKGQSTIRNFLSRILVPSTTHVVKYRARSVAHIGK